MPLSITMTDEERCLVHCSPKTEAGNPAPVEGNALFAVRSGTCTIAPNDALSAWVISGTAGQSIVEISADSDLGAGVVTISDLLTVTVTNAMAESLALTVDAPVLK